MRERSMEQLKKEQVEAEKREDIRRKYEAEQARLDGIRLQEEEERKAKEEEEEAIRLALEENKKPVYDRSSSDEQEEAVEVNME